MAHIPFAPRVDAILNYIRKRHACSGYPTPRPVSSTPLPSHPVFRNTKKKHVVLSIEKENARSLVTVPAIHLSVPPSRLEGPRCVFAQLQPDHVLVHTAYHHRIATTRYALVHITPRRYHYTPVPPMVRLVAVPTRQHH